MYMKRSGAVYCVTGVYLREIINSVFLSFTLECESSECNLSACLSDFYIYFFNPDKEMLNTWNEVDGAVVQSNKAFALLFRV